MEKQNIRIKLRAYDNKILDASTEEIVNTVKRTGATIKGPVPLPTKIESVRFESSSKTQQPQHSNSEQPGFVYFCHFSSAADCTLEKRAFWNFCPDNTTTSKFELRT